MAPSAASSFSMLIRDYALDGIISVIGMRERLEHGLRHIDEALIVHASSSGWADSRLMHGFAVPSKYECRYHGCLCSLL
jgi:hypothetical protein